MNVLFIYSLDDIQSKQKPLRSWSTIQFGISYISSVLRAHGHHTRLLVLGSDNWMKSVRSVHAAMGELDPPLICFTSVFSQYSFIKKLAQTIKSQWPDKFLIIGGVHATLNSNDVIHDAFDALCAGEGEFPTLELCGLLESGQSPRGIANCWIKRDGGRVEKNEPRTFLQDLDALPFPDREMWGPWMKAQPDDEMSVLLGRGCPYDCTYCSNHVLRKVAGGKYVRMRSPENIIKELAFLHDHYPHRKIYFEVESIALNKSWAIELCGRLETFNASIHHSFSYGCNFRISPNSMNEELFSAFEKANFFRINIGLESGSERIRREVLKRDYSNRDFLNVVSMARKHGLNIHLFNMIGIPGESLSDHMETVRLNRECQPDGHFTSIFFPYPGTELYESCIQQGLLPDSIDTRMERRQTSVKLAGFTGKQIQRAYTWFNYHVYKGHKPRWILLLQTLAVKIQSNPKTNYLYRKMVQWPIIRHFYGKMT
jgi:anaerobic magnesium-protoporphyrin IX monomethyl ester cyclase